MVLPLAKVGALLGIGSRCGAKGAADSTELATLVDLKPLSDMFDAMLGSKLLLPDAAACIIAFAAAACCACCCCCTCCCWCCAIASFVNALLSWLFVDMVSLLAPSVEGFAADISDAFDAAIACPSAEVERPAVSPVEPRV